MSIEAHINNAIGEEVDKEYRRCKRRIAERLAARFNLDAYEVDASLQDTKYVDMFSTGSVAWYITYNGNLVWYTRPKSNKKHGVDEHNDLVKLRDRLEK